jgi:hypothetical protein
MFATATEAIEHISTKAKPNQDTRIIKAIKPGHMIRQGDIYAINVDGMTSIEVFQTVKVDFKNYTSKVKTNKTHYQLVPGSTKGSRHTVKNDMEIFVNPTNDSWFGEGAELFLHSHLARWQVAREQVPMVRPTNTGLSMVIAPWGEVLTQGRVGVEELILTELPLSTQWSP